MQGQVREGEEVLSEVRVSEERYGIFYKLDMGVGEMLMFRAACAMCGKSLNAAVEKAGKNQPVVQGQKFTQK